MASARKQREDQSGAQPGVTLPAPPKGSGEMPAVDASPDEKLSSSRPTSVPEYDMGALAAASLQGVPRSRVPLDLAVPVRRRASADGAPLRAAFLLAHVDDRASIAEIAAWAQIPLPEAIDAFCLLATLGLVELRGVPDEPSAPHGEQKPAMPIHESGLRPKTG
jgi:hypothetical protein